MRELYMVSDVFSGSSYFNLFIMPMVLEIVFAILIICCFQFRCLAYVLKVIKFVDAFYICVIDC